MMKNINIKKLLILNIPYLLVGLFATNLGEAWRLAEGADMSAKLLSFFSTITVAMGNPLPSFHPMDLMVGIICGAVLRLAVYIKGKNAKKYRHNEEYGSARWGTAKDIEPFMAPDFEDNIILTKTERLMMSNRPKNPANARNKNVLIVGGSGSGKTRFWLKPNLLQCNSKKFPVSFVITDPKGSIVVECGNALLHFGYNIKIFNTINFKKSMHYNPFAYIHSEKDILKLVTTLIANTKGDGKAGDEFWTKAETLLYCALIGYIHYEAPVEEQNFSTLIEFLNAMEVREDDEEFQNPVDLMFEALEKKKPNHFAVRQYKKYKLAAGETKASGLLKWFGTGYKKIWTEYSGIVELGIDVNKVSVSSPGADGVVKITIPDAEILNVDLDEDSMGEPLTDTGFLTEITKEEETAALAEAQDNMEETAKQNSALLAQAKERAKNLIEGYVKNVGEQIGEEYTIEWEEIE